MRTGNATIICGKRCFCEAENISQTLWGKSGGTPRSLIVMNLKRSQVSCVLNASQMTRGLLLYCSGVFNDAVSMLHK
jgi:hypothetical protein